MLSFRLKKLVELLPSDAYFVADIGADHGFVSKEILDTRSKIKVFASDNKLGPYNRLKKALSTYQNVIVSLSDGLDALPSDVDTILISGMGGKTISSILLKNKEKLNKVKYLILSPHNDLYSLRKEVNSLDFKIIDECFIKDADKFYSIIVYQKGKETLDEIELRYGPIILKNKNVDFQEYLNDEIAHREYLLHTKKLNINRIKEINQEIEELKKL